MVSKPWRNYSPGAPPRRSPNTRSSDQWWVALTPAAGLLAGAAMVGVLASSRVDQGHLAAMLAATAAGLGGAWMVLRRTRGAALLALGMGAVSVVVGAALGVRYILAGEPSPRSAAAVIALPAGATLIALGGAALVHGLPWRRALAAVFTSAALVTFVGLLVAPGVLATNVPPMPGSPLTPADRGLAYQDVTMRTSDGLTLAGWYLPSHNGAAVVLRHGSSATKASELDHLEVLAKAGFGVLVPDGRGRGQSRGAAMDFGWYGDEDLEPAIDLLSTRPDVDPGRIGIVGISLGGMEAIGTAGIDPRVRAVVAEGATRRSDADLEWLTDTYGILGTFRLGINRLQFAVTELIADREAPPSLADSVADAEQTAFLLVTADDGDEIAAAVHIRQRAPDRVTIWTIAGASHARGSVAAPNEWRDTVVSFLSRALRHTK